MLHDGTQQDEFRVTWQACWRSNQRIKIPEAHDKFGLHGIHPSSGKSSFALVQVEDALGFRVELTPPHRYSGHRKRTYSSGLCHMQRPLRAQVRHFTALRRR
jgi:hypothetical protein